MGDKGVSPVSRQHMKVLVARSSLGESRAVRLRRATPSFVRDRIVKQSGTVRDSPPRST